MTPTADSTMANPKIEVAQHFEPRYHIEADAIETARDYKTIDSDGKDWSSTIGGSTNAVICSYLNNKLANLKRLFDWLDSTDTSHASNKPFTELDQYNNVESITLEVTARSDDNTVDYEDRLDGDIEKTYGIFHNDTIEFRRQKFRTEFE